MDDGRRTAHDDGRQPIAIGHLSDSGNLNLVHLRMICAKFVWNWLSDSGEDGKMTGLLTDGQTIRNAHLSFQLK